MDLFKHCCPFCGHYFTHKISLYMKVKYIIVNIVNRNVKMEVVSRDTYIPYMKVKHISVDIIVNLKQQYNIVLTNTSS